MAPTAPTITSRTQYEVLRLFAQGKTEQAIADYTTLNLSAVRRTINEMAAGDRELATTAVAAYEHRASAVAAARGTPPPAPPPGPAARPSPGPAAPASPPVDTLAQLLHAAAASPSRRVQALGEKLRALAGEVRDALERERQAAEAQRRVDELAAQLEEAREALRTATGRPARPATPTAVAQGPATEVTPKTVREWARKNGVEVPALGRIPRTVMDAYLAAHPTTEPAKEQ
ncbi:Lsr2 family protein [Micromonospora sp. WMMD1076]|uniref:Lsr2 family DNA-binding protein n=1 Tax=Micromonospora sp. WMMD1076 TaxID=3016103 RepID=UPI00249A64F2|nr:histone-like nucleoid-structuring protein Lsr2 [Micromonospora sp. WMMD1076]WFF07233.1 Lsr2 family protein [Micromonospora sp. WMMD1076]